MIVEKGSVSAFLAPSFAEPHERFLEEHSIESGEIAVAIGCACYGNAVQAEELNFLANQISKDALIIGLDPFVKVAWWKSRLKTIEIRGGFEMTDRVLKVLLVNGFTHLANVKEQLHRRVDKVLAVFPDSENTISILRSGLGFLKDSGSVLTLVTHSSDLNVIYDIPVDMPDLIHLADTFNKSLSENDILFELDGREYSFKTEKMTGDDYLKKGYPETEHLRLVYNDPSFLVTEAAVF